jgi:hypothetical protein
MPFEIKNIYGLSAPEELEGEEVVIKGAADADSKECTICLSFDSNVICLPCGHLCMCKDCGK